MESLCALILPSVVAGIAVDNGAYCRPVESRGFLESGHPSELLLEPRVNAVVVAAPGLAEQAAVTVPVAVSLQLPSMWWQWVEADLARLVAVFGLSVVAVSVSG